MTVADYVAAPGVTFDVPECVDKWDRRRLVREAMFWVVDGGRGDLRGMALDTPSLYSFLALVDGILERALEGGWASSEPLAPLSDACAFVPLPAALDAVGRGRITDWRRGVDLAVWKSLHVLVLAIVNASDVPLVGAGTGGMPEGWLLGFGAAAPQSPSIGSAELLPTWEGALSEMASDMLPTVFATVSHDGSWAAYESGSPMPVASVERAYAEIIADVLDPLPLPWRPDTSTRRAGEGSGSYQGYYVAGVQQWDCTGESHVSFEPFATMRFCGGALPQIMRDVVERMSVTYSLVQIGWHTEVAQFSWTRQWRESSPYRRYVGAGSPFVTIDDVCGGGAFVELPSAPLSWSDDVPQVYGGGCALGCLGDLYGIEALFADMGSTWVYDLAMDDAAFRAKWGDGKSAFTARGFVIPASIVHSETTRPVTFREFVWKEFATPECLLDIAVQTSRPLVPRLDEYTAYPASSRSGKVAGIDAVCAFGVQDGVAWDCADGRPARRSVVPPRLFVTRAPWGNRSQTMAHCGEDVASRFVDGLDGFLSGMLPPALERMSEWCEEAIADYQGPAGQDDRAMMDEMVADGWRWEYSPRVKVVDADGVEWAYPVAVSRLDGSRIDVVPGFPFSLRCSRTILDPVEMPSLACEWRAWSDRRVVTQNFWRFSACGVNWR